MSGLEILGLTGQVFFFSRFLIQWALSERAKRSLTPPVFWWLSLVGTAILTVYSLERSEHVLLVGYAVNGAIYARNLWLQYVGNGRILGRLPLTLLAVAAAVAVVAAAIYRLQTDPGASIGWLACVAIGQTVWTSRFVVQWWCTERTGVSHFPASFWWLSLVGNLLLLAYAVHLGYPTYIAAFIPGPIVQIRNLMLSGRKAQELREVELTPRARPVTGTAVAPASAQADAARDRSGV